MNDDELDQLKRGEAEVQKEIRPFDNFDSSHQNKTSSSAARTTANTMSETEKQRQDDEDDFQSSSYANNNGKKYISGGDEIYSEAAKDGKNNKHITPSMMEAQRELLYQWEDEEYLDGTHGTMESYGDDLDWNAFEDEEVGYSEEYASGSLLD